MDLLSMILHKRDGGAHGAAELEALAEGVAAGALPDYQLAAWLMAVYFQGMTDEETAELTLAMARSGRMLDLSSLPGPVVDKHSTGGVGDKTTLVVAPLAAATGLTVAKMSGRGLGHTGGTLDKLEAVPGLTVEIGPRRFLRQAERIGLVIAGQTEDLAPADKRLYALRDVTGTVPSLPLIAASVMSKKIAAGAGAIALDVKAGRGAFMKDPASAAELARAMARIGHLAGRRVAAAVTAMDQPLGRAVGNALELREAVATLEGEGPADLRELCLLVAGLMHVLAGRAASPEAARPALERALASGAAREKLDALVEAQSGDPGALARPEGLPRAPVVREVPAPRAGFVQALDALAVGEASVALGAGRRRKDAPVDPAVGIVLAAKRGDERAAGEPLAEIHARREADAERAAELVAAAYAWADEPPQPAPLVYEIIDTDAAGGG